MLVGYVRVSTIEQNEERQLETLKSYNIEKLFSEKVSGKNTDRPKLQEMLNFVRDGDKVIVTELDRLGRNMRDLLSIVEELDSKGVVLTSVKEGTFDTKTAMGKFMLQILASAAEMERNLIKERQAEGIAIAKQQGKYKGKPIKKLENEEEVLKLVRNKEITATKASELLNCSRGTIYNRLNKVS